jgi:uncharacterized damage-inducible protein DinB
MDKRIELIKELTDDSFDGISFNDTSFIKTLEEFGWEKAATIPDGQERSAWELAMHIIYWKFDILKIIDPDTKEDIISFNQEDWPSLPAEPNSQKYELLIKEAKIVHAAFLSAIELFDDSRLEDEIKDWQMSYAKALALLPTHEVYHTAQMRNMY